MRATFCGEYVIETADHMIMGLIREGKSLSFVEWETITCSILLA